MTEATEIEDQFGKPDYKAYPIVGYSYSVLAKILDMQKPTMMEELSYGVAALLSKLEDSPLDHGYYVFAVIKNGTPVHIGIGEGKGNRRPIAAARKKYSAGVVWLLAYALSKSQAETIKRTLTNRYRRKANVSSGV